MTAELERRPITQQVAKVLAYNAGYSKWQDDLDDRRRETYLRGASRLLDNLGDWATREGCHELADALANALGLSEANRMWGPDGDAANGCSPFDEGRTS